MATSTLEVEEFIADESFRDTIGTVQADGKRKWIYAKKPKGKFTNYRKYVALLLLAFLVIAPFVKVGGHQFMLFNVLERKFVILGFPFWPHDIHLAVLAVLTAIVFLIVFTMAFGRIFCGWVCPQTIFMEWVFRRVEYLIEGDAAQQRALDREPWNTPKILKKTSKHLIFYGLSFFIGNIFLAYLIGREALIEIITDPPNAHIAGLAGMIAFSGVFYFVFARFREQACIVACPYGRLQGVLIDPNTIVVAYDYKRGEPRAKIKKEEVQTNRGDCVDCSLCEHVCPTGIDIRNGTQLECVNCTACIDACDDIMTRVKKPTGLIRYASLNQISKGTKFNFTTRMKAYSLFLTALIGVFISLIVLRSDVETTITRMRGTMYQTEPNGNITNVYEYQLMNKTALNHKISFRLLEPQAGIIRFSTPENFIFTPAEKVVKNVFIVEIPPTVLKGIKNNVKFEVVDENNTVIDVITTNFVGPVQ